MTLKSKLLVNKRSIILGLHYVILLAYIYSFMGAEKQQLSQLEYTYKKMRSSIIIHQDNQTMLSNRRLTQQQLIGLMHLDSFKDLQWRSKDQDILQILVNADDYAMNSFIKTLIDAELIITQITHNHSSWLIGLNRKFGHTNISMNTAVLSAFCDTRPLKNFSNMLYRLDNIPLKNLNYIAYFTFNNNRQALLTDAENNFYTASVGKKLFQGAVIDEVQKHKLIIALPNHQRMVIKMRLA